MDLKPLANLRHLLSVEETAKDGADRIGIALLPEDPAEPEADAALKDGMEISIRQAIPVRIAADGKAAGLLTAKRAGRDVLALGHIRYGFTRAADIGSAIKANRIDLYCPAREETGRYDVKGIKVYVPEQ